MIETDVLTKMKVNCVKGMDQVGNEQSQSESRQGHFDFLHGHKALEKDVARVSRLLTEKAPVTPISGSG